MKIRNILILITLYLVAANCSRMHLKKTAPIPKSGYLNFCSECSFLKMQFLTCICQGPSPVILDGSTCLETTNEVIRIQNDKSFENKNPAVFSKGSEITVSDNTGTVFYKYDLNKVIGFENGNLVCNPLPKN